MRGDTYSVTAAVDTKLGGGRDSAAEEEEGVQHIQTDHEHGVELEALLECGGDEVEQAQHAEDGDEQIVVDDRGVTGDGGVDHVADQSHDEKSPEELEATEGEVDDGHVVGVGGCV